VGGGGVGGAWGVRVFLSVVWGVFWGCKTTISFFFFCFLKTNKPKKALFFLFGGGGGFGGIALVGGVLGGGGGGFGVGWGGGGWGVFLISQRRMSFQEDFWYIIFLVTFPPLSGLKNLAPRCRESPHLRDSIDFFFPPSPSAVTSSSCVRNL